MKSIPSEKPEKLSDTEDKQFPTLSEKEARLFQLANWSLGILAFLLFLSALTYVYYPDIGAHIFDASLKTLPPFATLILGYYFASKNS
ncbi:MAG: hypothetical protein HRT90_00385 [Candidatus Margulisbacteria bacterium]|nr:hypothetical protein [Candidatus Margulisiibacteriota bacterium]